MGDFAQSGLICTLQRLNETHLAALETELSDLAKDRPITLILPCHASELDRPALSHLCTELREARWLREIIVSLNGFTKDLQTAAARTFAKLPHARLLWIDGPEIAPILADLLGCAATDLPHGKGLNVWVAAGIVALEERSELILTQDCDVTSFRRVSLARLAYACAHPKLNFGFAKMYYPRVTDRLYGRVTRLFLSPLLQALVRTAGHHPLLDFLLSFRYPLAGECAIRRTVIESLPMHPGWGLEIGLLCELFRKVDPREICQVDGGSDYDHKHQPVTAGLEGMCSEIAETLLEQLASEGVLVSDSLRQAVVGAYQREGSLAVQRSAALALINGVPFDEGEEGENVRIFGNCLTRLPSSQKSSALPSWTRLARENRECLHRLLAIA